MNPIRHIPIDLGVVLPARPAGCVRISYVYGYGGSSENDWDHESLTAEFGIGSNLDHFVRIEFDGPVIFRVLDETWLSTSTDSRRWEGDLTTFARLVEGDDFANLHSIFFKIATAAKHYQFVTNSACLDVITAAMPKASLHQKEES